MIDGMSFFAILFALMLEQARPLQRDNPAYQGLKAWAVSVRRSLDAQVDESEQVLATSPWLAVGTAVLVPVLAAMGVYWLLLATIGWPLALLWNVAILYLTLGFRQFSHHFTAIRDALTEGDLPAARSAFAHWHPQADPAPTEQGLLEQVVAHSVVQAHRHVFGVFLWFTLSMLLGLGPAGAVLYRTAEYLGRDWSAQPSAGVQPVSEPLQAAVQRAWWWLDWLPARLTAIGFAVVGSFEDTLAGWRTYAQKAPQDNDGLVIAATAGALHIDLGTYGMPNGLAPQMQHLYSLVGLVWRLVAVWLLLLALLTLGRLLG